MNPEVVLKTDRVGKAYRIWTGPTGRLASPLWSMAARRMPATSLRRWMENRAKLHYRDFRALSDISLEIKRGESVGIVGRNGSGKSTLLQIIAGTLQPSEGTVNVHGRVAALLELGSGFNPEFTGRENVYLNGALLGLSREDIDQRYDAIAAFAEIGEFIEQPVKTYSSGMVVRLAFAVAAHVDPDILIIDEALSVGDARFQLKCARAIDQFLARGVTLLFVSHDTTSVKRLCNRAILLEQGHVIYQGLPNDVVNLYSKLVADNGSLETIAPDIEKLQQGGQTPAVPTLTEPANSAPPASPSSVPIVAGAGDLEPLRLRLKALEALLQAHPHGMDILRKASLMLDNERRHAGRSGHEFSYGGELGRIHEIDTRDTDGQSRSWFTTGETVVVRIEAESFEHLVEPIFALTIKNVAGVEIYGTNTLFSQQPARPMKPGERRVVTFTFAINLMPGYYFLSLGFTHFFGEELVVIHRRYDAIKLEIHGADRTFGIVNLHAKIEEQNVLPADAV